MRVERAIKRFGAGAAGREQRVRFRVEPVAQAIERAERGGAGGERLRQRTAGAQQRLAALAQRALAQPEFGFESPTIHGAERSAQFGVGDRLILPVEQRVLVALAAADIEPRSVGQNKDAADPQKPLVVMERIGRLAGKAEQQVADRRERRGLA